VDPGSLQALGLVPFQVNVHYPDGEPAGPPGSETRQERIAEFLEENDVPVIGLRDGTWLRVSREVATLGGWPAAGSSGAAPDLRSFPRDQMYPRCSACPPCSTAASRPARARPAARTRDSDGPSIRQPGQLGCIPL
jgi:dipeptidase E